jgi:hypothetical protein
MLLEDYYSEPNGNLSFTREQGSNFAKHVADDFNPLHDEGAKRFCIPGDLLFSVMLAKYGLSTHLECTFSGFVGAGIELVLPEASEELHINDAAGKEYLRLERRGDNSRDQSVIQNLARQYVEFSGHTFPHILVPLLAEHGVMINPDRPMVMYQSMSIDLDTLDIQQPTLHSDHSELEINGKRGNAMLAFNLLESESGEIVGRGKKQILLSGLREYDSDFMEAAVATYNERKRTFFAKAD